ncbi:WAT1-related protein At5g40240 [Linum grandiflorum]
MGLGSLFKVAIPYVAMVAVDFSDVVISAISKAAMAKGMSNFVSVVYYNALATLILLPHFLFFRNQRAPLTLHLLWRFFLLALIGSTGQMAYLTGVKLSSPTLASAITNLIPIFTFLLAILTRMETINIRIRASQVKCIGAIVAVTGAFIVTLYKGPVIWQGPTTGLNSDQHHPLDSQQSDWVLGSVLFTAVAFMAATWNVAQGATVKQYPEEMTIVFFFTLFITIQSAVFSVVLEKNPNAWKLKSRIEFIAIVYTAIFGSVFRIALRTWCLREKGPVFVSMFSPLGIGIAVVISVMFLGDGLYLGSVIGIIGIGVGFYSVMWGKIKEEEERTAMVTSVNIEEEPLMI